MSRFTIDYAGNGAGEVVLRDNGTIVRRGQLTPDTVGGVAAQLAGVMGVEAPEVERELRAAMDPAHDFLPVSATDLLRDCPDLRPYVITGIVRRGEVANLVGASKARKSWLAQQIGISVKAGRMLFERFEVDAGPVLIVDSELHRETLSHRLGMVARGLGVMSDELRHLDLLPLRGNLRDLHQLRPTLDRIPANHYRLIIIDTLYRLLPADTDENSNGAITAIYNRLDELADRTGAAILVVHHLSKGHQGGKATTDLGAGAGAQARAPDVHAGLRDHEEDDVVVFDSVLRSSPPLPPFCLRWEYPVWKLAEDLDPELIREPGRKRKPTEQAEPWTAERFTKQFVRAGTPDRRDAILARAGAEGLSQRKATQLLAQAVADGHVFEHRGKGANTPTLYATLPPSAEVES